jgi:hypothetical protein
MNDTPTSFSAEPDEAIELAIGRYRVEASTRFGPRITGLRWDDGPELLARLGPEHNAAAPLGTFLFHGGHRLWVAPEELDVTYAPDDHECQVSIDADRMTVTAAPDRAGFAKELQVTADGESLAIEHRLTWTGESPVVVSPWAITQLPLGGIAVLPLGGPDRPVLQANRSLVLWPYTKLDDTRIGWIANSIVIRCDSGPSLKLGTGPDPRRLGYLRGDLLFVKEFAPGEIDHHPDRGAVGQIYVGDAFCELESVGPLVSLLPGEDTLHHETWTVTTCADHSTALDLLGGLA